MTTVASKPPKGGTKIKLRMGTEVPKWGIKIQERSPWMGTRSKDDPKGGDDITVSETAEPETQTLLVFGGYGEINKWDELPVDLTTRIRCCTSFGLNARVLGYCCIAIGDYTSASGIFEVITSDEITIPLLFTREMARYDIVYLETRKLFYTNLKGDLVPLDFGERASEAIDSLIKIIKERFDL